MPDSREIEQLRPPRKTWNPDQPIHFLREQEPDDHGILQDINTIFLTCKECSFRCLMCDLWKNTLEQLTPPGAIPRQIDFALARLPAARTIKLYSSGNFFDSGSIPRQDYEGIIDRVRSYQRVIVENHPSLCGKNCVEFSEKLSGELEVAMGLETIHPVVLPKLNKRLTPEDFGRAAAFLISRGIHVRAFVLLHPPFLAGRAENLKWTTESVRFAFESGAGCCSIIPTRPGNGIMDLLQRQGEFMPPTLEELEDAVDEALGLGLGRVFADTWGLDSLSQCPTCFESRKGRLEDMNLDQKIHSRIPCTCGYA